MKFLLIFCISLLSIPSILKSQPQAGDEHWRQNDQIIEGRYVASCSNNGIVYVCFSTNILSKFSIYEISESGVKKKLDFLLWPQGTSKISSMIFYNNDLIIAGEFERINDDLAKGCARYDGSRWNRLGLGIEGTVTGCISDGQAVYFTGALRSVGGQPSTDFVKWDGRIWTILHGVNCLVLSYGTLINSDWYYIGQLSLLDNFIYATSNLMNPVQGNKYALDCKDNRYQNGIIRYSISEDRWEQIIPSQKPDRGTPRIVKITDYFFVDKDLYLSGVFNNKNVISLYNLKNGVWTFLGDMKENEYVESMTYSNKSLYIAGKFSGIGNVVSNNIVKWDGVRWISLGSGISGGRKDYITRKWRNPCFSPSENLFTGIMNRSESEIVNKLLPFGSSILVLGNFDKAGSISSYSLASWDELKSVVIPSVDSLIGISEKEFTEAEYDKALININLAIDINPNNPEAYNLRGAIQTYIFNSKINKGDYDNLRDRAYSDLSMAIKLKPDFAFAYMYRGLLGYLDENPYKKFNPEEDLEMSIQLNDKNAQAYYFLGLYYRKMKSEKLIRSFENAMKYYNDVFMIQLCHFYIGEYYFNIKQYPKAIDELSFYISGVTIQSDNQYNLFDAWRFRGLSYYDLHDFDKALKDFNEILKKYPNEKSVGDIYYLRGKILFKKSGNYKDACPDMKKARDLGNDDARKFVDEVCK